jgi:hypothetical protein
MPNLMTADHVRWEVLWIKVKKKKKKVVVIEFLDDLQGAIELYHKAKNAGKPFATLRCCNVGFPPPDKYRPRWVVKKTGTGKYVYVNKRSKKTGKVKKVKVERIKREEIYHEPMAAMNLRGWWWCPYCMEMRRFEKQNGFLVEGVRVPEVGFHCLICGVSHRDHHVRKWNPQAQRVEYKLNQPRASKKNGNVSKRRRSRRS